MSQENFEQFRQAVLQDPDLQRQLRAASSLEDLIALTQQLGAARGFSFTTEDVSETWRANQRAWIERWLH